jgi:hypothetical protein
LYTYIHSIDDEIFVFVYHSISQKYANKSNELGSNWILKISAEHKQYRGKWKPKEVVVFTKAGGGGGGGAPPRNKKKHKK